MGYSKIFLDNNIITDFLVESRGELHEKAVKLFKNFDDKSAICYSFESISDISYILNKHYKLNIEMIVNFFCNFIKIYKFQMSFVIK